VYHTSVRFLLTNSCNIRCSYCHNEFQGDLGRQPAAVAWDQGLLLSLLRKAHSEGICRAKFSGGEPLLRWRELCGLGELCAREGLVDQTVFTNLTLMSSEKAYALVRGGVRRFNCNLPSFQAASFASRTGQRRWPLTAVLRSSRLLRQLGCYVQFNLVVSVTDYLSVAATIASELDGAQRHIDAWDALAFLADDRLAGRDMLHALIADVLATTCHGTRATDRGRSYEFRWKERRLVASRCTNWNDPAEAAGADLYIVPPGTAMTNFVRGRAYR
jgi:molybdenum cofactor biosynthesis enzyme MoaA